VVSTVVLAPPHVVTLSRWRLGVPVSALTDYRRREQHVDSAASLLFQHLIFLGADRYFQFIDAQQTTSIMLLTGQTDGSGAAVTIEWAVGEYHRVREREREGDGEAASKSKKRMRSGD
jgi:hypothetical protein